MKRSMLVFFLAVISVLGLAGLSSADENGRKLFETYCAKCHGQDGSVSEYGHSIKPLPARDLRPNRLFIAPAELLVIIKYGVYGREMKGWESVLKDNEIKEVAAYLRTLKYTPDIEEGKKFFAAKCASCHEKNGPAKKLFGAPDLDMSPLGETELARTIRFGRHGTMMFPKMELFSNVDIANVVAYLVSIKK